MDEQLDFYARQGYLVVPDALSADQVEAINDAIDRNLDQYPRLWIEREEGHTTLNVHTLMAHPEMDITMRPPTLLPLMEAILGDEICAEEHSVRIRRPHQGEPYCNWHRDGGGWPAEPPYYTRYLSIAFYLSDVDASTHTFSVLPGSAQTSYSDFAQLEAYDLDQAHHIEGPKGTAVLFNAGMFHAGNVRRTPTERRTIHIYCGRTSAPALSNYTIFPRRLWQDKDPSTQKYYSRPNPISQLILNHF